MKRTLSVIVPVYNSEASLLELVNRLRPVLQTIADDAELILINDASTDKSWEIVQQLAKQNAWIRGINLMRNYGQHNAVLCGIRFARFEIIVTMDDDLQHPPEELPRLLIALEQGCDVVYGIPEREQHGLARDLASQLTKLALQHAMGAETARNVGAFRIFRTDVRNAFSSYHGPYVALDVLLTWGARSFAAVRVRRDPRKHGRSGYSARKLVVTALNLTTGFSTLPLHIASFLGFLFTAFGLSVLAYVIGRYLIEGGSVPGFPFLASLIAIFSGVQLFALGIIGEYLARIHLRTMDRPPYVVRSVTEPSE